MTNDAASIPISILLAWRDAETGRWHEWFSTHPQETLFIPAGEGRMATLHGLLVHIFAVELRYAQRLVEQPVSDWSEIDPHTLDETFAIGDVARALIGGYLETADDDSLDEERTFLTMTAGTITATKRKMLFNLVPHGMRHWAQVAMLLRQAGHRDQWSHDLLGSAVMK
jgi:uncharacterized damage-inducible protein DinB